MEETHKNCFGSKIRNSTLRQAKTGKNECRNITATYVNTFDSEIILSIKRIELLDSALLMDQVSYSCMHVKNHIIFFFEKKNIVLKFLRRNYNDNNNKHFFLKCKNFTYSIMQK